MSDINNTNQEPAITTYSRFFERYRMQPLTAGLIDGYRESSMRLYRETRDSIRALNLSREDNNTFALKLNTWAEHNLSQIRACNQAHMINSSVTMGPTLVTEIRQLLRDVMVTEQLVSENERLRRVLGEQNIEMERMNREMEAFMRRRGREAGIDRIRERIAEITRELREEPQDAIQRTLILSMSDTSRAQPIDPSAHVGENARNLADDSDVPERFLCIITGQIMTTPVYDPRNPNQCFEKEAIEKSLSMKAENPCNRQPLVGSQLVVNEGLQGEISDWMGEALKPKVARPS